MKGSNVRRCAVIGAGASGISAAYHLQKRGIQVDLIERGTSIGGRIASEALGNRYIDFGGKNIGREYHVFRKFVSDLGKFEYVSEGYNVGQIVDGKLVTFDASRKITSHYHRIRLFGVKDYLRLLYFMSSIMLNPSNRYIGGPFFNKLAAKYDMRPISDYFSDNFNKRLVRLVTVRTNGAEPDEYFLGNFGTNVGTMLDKYDVLADGMKPVLDEFGKKVRVILGSSVQGIKDLGETVQVSMMSGEEKTTELYDHVVIATPARSAANILEDLYPEASEELRRIQYFPLAVAIVQYEQNVLTPETRALIFDSTKAVSVASAYSPEDLNLIRYTCSGREARRLINRSTSGEEAVNIAEEAIAPFFNVTKNNRTNFVYKYFDEGACAYSPFHFERLKKINRAISSSTRISLCGDYFRGSSIEGCFKSGAESAAAI